MAAHQKDNTSDVTGVRSPADGRLHSSSSPVHLPFSLFRLPLPFSERRLLLMGLDLLAINGALLLAFFPPELVLSIAEGSGGD
jgi:hypothetical protein